MTVELILNWLIATSWQVALLVVLVLVLQRMLGRWLTPRWRYALWLLVLARLFLPVQPEVARGAVDWDLVSLHEWPVSTVPSQPEPGESTDTSSDAMLAETLDESGPEATTAPARVGESAPTRFSAEQRPVSLLGASSEPKLPEDPRASQKPPIHWTLWLTLAWLATVVLLIARDLYRERAFRRSLRRAAPVSDRAVTELFEQCRLAARFDRSVELVHTDLVGSPAAAGWLRPAHPVANPDSRRL